MDVSLDRSVRAHLDRGVAVIKRLTIWRAIQGVPESPGGDGIAFAGLGEVWFDDFDGAAAATQTPEWSAVISDASTSMNLNAVVAAWADEHRIIDPSWHSSRESGRGTGR